MLATNASAEVVERLLQKHRGPLYLANVNAPDQCVIGGKRAPLADMAAALEAEKFQARVLAVPAAFHTPLMAGASRLLEQELRTARLQAPAIAVISTVNNQRVRNVAEIRRNLAAQLTTPVRYSPLIAELAAAEPTVFVEVGPHQTLTRLNRRILGGDAPLVACDNPKRAGLEPLLSAQALLECVGALAAAPAHRAISKTSLPAKTSSTPPEVGKARTMHDHIPHFDATERRRAKMRGGSGGAPNAANGAPDHAPPAARKPAPAAPRVQTSPSAPPAVKPPAAPQPQPPLVPKTARFAPAPAVPVAASPPPPARPTPVPVPAPVASKPSNGSHVAGTSRPAPAELESFSDQLRRRADRLSGRSGRSRRRPRSRSGHRQHQEGSALWRAARVLRRRLVGRQPLARRLPHAPPRAELLAESRGLSSSRAAAQNGAAAHPSVSEPSTNGTHANGAPAQPANAPAPAELESFLINFVVEQTGYPAEVVDLDADLEADLGIDSIKKAQLFGELQEYFDVGSSVASLSLDDFPTLRHVLNFLQGLGSETPSVAAPSIEMPSNRDRQPRAARRRRATARIRPKPLTSRPALNRPRLNWSRF